jgi:hypothetical protein
MIAPNDHFQLYESTAYSAKELKHLIDQVQARAEREECDVYWRGQADHGWAITSSLARFTDVPSAVQDVHLNSAEAELLSEARRWVTASQTIPSNDLEWLALLQHHGVPTRMLDFTSDPLVATFFAVEDLDATDGRLFAILIPKSASAVDSAEATDFKIGALRQSVIRLWRPDPKISPRLAAQKGVFLLGKLPSTYPSRHAKDSLTEIDRQMTRSEVVSVMSIPLYLIPLDRERREGSPAPSSVTIRIHVDKAAIREQLAKLSNSGSLRPSGQPINHATCYPDVDGMKDYSRILQRIKRGLN